MFHLESVVAKCAAALKTSYSAEKKPQPNINLHPPHVVIERAIFGATFWFLVQLHALREMITIKFVSTSGIQIPGSGFIARQSLSINYFLRSAW